MSDNWRYVTPPSQSFARVPVCTHLDELDAKIAIIGLHYVSPYPLKFSAASANGAVETAPDAIRRQSSIFTDHLDHYSFDFNDVLLAGREVRIVDCGDIDRQPAGGQQNPKYITAAIRTILERGSNTCCIGHR